jgi:DNA excision repair protein ERCC-5
VQGWLRTKVTLQHDFPSEAVAEAYRHPQVDESQERFEWGLPDIDGLRRFARGKMGWPDEKVDELVLPILKRFAEAEQAAQDPSSAGLQTSINDFFAAASSNRRLNPKIKRSFLPTSRCRHASVHPISR